MLKLKKQEYEIDIEKQDVFLSAKPNQKIDCYSFSIPSISTKINNQQYTICKTAIEKNLPCLNFCYANRLEHLRPRMYAKNLRNFIETKKENFVEKLSSEIKVIQPKIYRFHVSGEFYSNEYFEKIVEITKMFPKTIFYAYTSEKHLGIIERPKNFILILSSPMGIYNEIPEGFDKIAKSLNKEFIDLSKQCPNELNKTLKCMKDCVRCIDKQHKEILFKIR